MVEDEGLTEDDYASQRRRMVEYQIERRGIENPLILNAMSAVPRHEFVPVQLRSAAYDDRPLPIGAGQTISQPYVVARMAELGRIRPTDHVLEIGAGSGYAAAVFAAIADRVTTVEIRPELAERARANLERLGYGNVTVLAGGIEAVDPDARFDVILTAAAAREIPSSLERLLSDGGRLVIPVGSRFSQYLWTVERSGNRYTRRRHDPVAFVPLI